MARRWEEWNPGRTTGLSNRQCHRHSRDARLRAASRSTVGSLAAHGRCPAAVRFVFAVEPDSECEAVIGRHGATMIRCRRLGPRNQTLKAVLYSAASVIEAASICASTPTRWFWKNWATLRMLGGAATSKRPRGQRRLPEGRTTGRSTHVITRAGTTTFLGSSALEDEANYPLVVNDGVFAQAVAADSSHWRACYEAGLMPLPGWIR